MLICFDVDLLCLSVSARFYLFIIYYKYKYKMQLLSSHHSLAQTNLTLQT